MDDVLVRGLQNDVRESPRQDTERGIKSTFFMMLISFTSILSILCRCSTLLDLANRAFRITYQLPYEVSGRDVKKELFHLHSTFLLLAIWQTLFSEDRVSKLSRIVMVMGTRDFGRQSTKRLAKN
mmetsp:Transcript_9225/g.17639  ORF Transcript_9225/g.17639 Transcript_9225/m.17639 type:complete len:125 (+) Transcript_9225:1353-1727(+)